ncbi:NACHT domain-containing protein [Streptomyces gelaticus]
MLLNSGQKLDSEQLVAWMGLFLSLAALAVSLAQFLPPLPPPTDAAQLADDLAVSVRAQWEDEVDARNLRVPRVIPLSWSATRRPVAAPPEETHGGITDARVLRLSLNGRLEGDFDQAARRLAQGYRRVPTGRLVVLGEPGSGKTVLAAMLNLGLLAEREPGAPVPVLLSLSGWDSVTESLRDWIERTLGTAYYGGRTEIPRLLLRGQRLLLILDGLDEMPETSRRIAVDKINKSSGEGAGVVLTCRSTEYQDIIEKGSPVLRRAPVVEVAPVSVADAVAYLSDVSWPAGVEWEPVYSRLRADPDSSTAVALSTPLTLTLARTVYSNCDRDPGELLDFDSSNGVEDHLLDHIITAAYAPPPGSGGQRDTDDWHRSAKQAEAYLTYLATYLHQHDERDLVWWLMSRRLSSRLTGFALGIAAGLLATFTMIGGMSLTGSKFEDGEGTVQALIGFGCAILTVIIWYAAPGESPGRLSPSRQGSLGRLGKGFAAGLRLTAILIVPVGAAGAVAIAVSGGWTDPDLAQYVMLVAGACGVALAISLALAAHAWLDAPPEHSKKATPRGLLQQDRTSSLVGALAAGTVLGAAAVPLLILGFSVAFAVFSGLTYGPVAPSTTGFIAERFHSNAAYSSKTAGIMSTLLPAAVFALLVLLTRAWPRFLLLRLTLAVQGKLPWNLIRFLSDARKKQLLRQSAGAYQFRHIRLQHRLASRAEAQDRVLPTRARNERRRTIQAATAAAAATLLLAGALAMPDTYRSAPDFIKTGDVEYMAFGPQGSDTLITINKQRKVRQWDTETGKELTDLRYTFPDPDTWEMPYDGRPFVAIADGLLERDYDRNEDDPATAYSPESEFGWKLLAWRGGKEKAPSTLHATDEPEDVSSNGRFHLDEYSEADPAANFITRNDTKTGKRLTCKLPSEQAYGMWRISGDGEIVAVAASDDQYVAVGTFDKCGELKKMTFGYHSVKSLALSSDGSELAVNADGITRLRTLDR